MSARLPFNIDRFIRCLGRKVYGYLVRAKATLDMLKDFTATVASGGAVIVHMVYSKPWNAEELKYIAKGDLLRV